MYASFSLPCCSLQACNLTTVCYRSQHGISFSITNDGAECHAHHLVLFFLGSKPSPGRLHRSYPLSRPNSDSPQKEYIGTCKGLHHQDFLHQPLLQTETHHISLTMVPKPTKKPSGDSQAVKKHRQGFKVGPDNLPDGPWRRKGACLDKTFFCPSQMSRLSISPQPAAPDNGSRKKMERQKKLK